MSFGVGTSKTGKLGKNFTCEKSGCARVKFTLSINVADLGVDLRKKLCSLSYVLTIFIKLVFLIMTKTYRFN